MCSNKTLLRVAGSKQNVVTGQRQALYGYLFRDNGEIRQQMVSVFVILLQMARVPSVTVTVWLYHHEICPPPYSLAKNTFYSVLRFFQSNR